ncbi:MAG: diguanylate cyclase [Chloroflexi bacterium]|nr:diguanylate cyclase [Chloroflexota bacterium]
MLGVLLLLVVLVILSLVITPTPTVILVVTLIAALGLGGLLVGVRGVRRGELRAAEKRANEVENQLQQIQEQALTDSLTGLWNTRHLRDQLPRELSRVKRHQIPMSLLILDVDHLKEVNDRLGHAAGDTLLRDVGKLIKEALRVSDIVGRWGGDEFLALLPEAGKADALAVAKRVRFRVEQYRLRVGSETRAVEVSMGIASHPVDGEEAEDLFGKADAAMYLAKKRGGSHISVYAGPVGGKGKRLGEYLMELGVSTAEQLEEALRYTLEATKRGEEMAVGQALVKLGYASAGEVEQALKLQAQERGTTAS